MRMGDYPPGVTGNEPELNDIDEMWIPDDCCRYCTHYKDDVCKGKTDCCSDYEWNGELLELPKKPVKPKREQYKEEWKYNIAVRTYERKHREWQAAYFRALETKGE